MLSAGRRPVVVLVPIVPPPMLVAQSAALAGKRMCQRHLGQFARRVVPDLWVRSQITYHRVYSLTSRTPFRRTVNARGGGWPASKHVPEAEGISVLPRWLRAVAQQLVPGPEAALRR